MENCKEDITVKIITPMFSYGVNKKKPEFRLSELKSSMRYWWRACNGFSDGKKMKDRENILFGSTKQISPVFFRNKTIKGDKFNDENIKEAFISSGKRFLVELQVKKLDEKKNPRDIEFYTNLLQLSSILGGLGKYVRKGQGVFYIEHKQEVISSSAQLIKKIKKLIMNIMEENRNFELKEEMQSDFVKHSSLNFSYKKEPCNYPYIQKIIVGNPIKMKQYMDRINETLASRQANDMEYNFNVKGYGKYKKYQRYACPVYITCYPCFHKESNQEQEVFPIIVLLKNTTLTDDKIKNYYENYFKYSKENGKKDEIITEEEREQVKKLYENFKSICIDYMIFGNCDK